MLFLCFIYYFRFYGNPCILIDHIQLNHVIFFSQDDYFRTWSPGKPFDQGKNLIILRKRHLNVNVCYIVEMLFIAWLEFKMLNT